ncbi:MAG TPA: multicopper oxidase domain-containing protein [Jatrophihabitans sp.]
MFYGQMFVDRFARIAISLVLVVGSITYAGVRLGWYEPKAAAATTPPTITIPHNAQVRGYSPHTLTIHKGQNVRVINRDSMRHSVTSDARNRHGSLFSTVLFSGQHATLATSHLAPGRYKFHCVFHPQMHGVLVVKGSGGGTTGSQSFKIPLFIPPVRTGTNITIPIERAPVKVFADGPKTVMWTYGGTYPGPTIKRNAGALTKITFIDKLPKADGSFSVHLHGDHHASKFDGQPTTFLIDPGHPRTYVYPLTDAKHSIPGAFFYYHDHRMLVTGRNNWRGLQGVFLVHNPAEDKFNLPTGRYDVPVVVSDRSFTSTNQLKNPFPKHPMMEMTGPSAPPNDATVGNTILVNGRYSPYFNVATHHYRLRLLNASNFQSYDFKLSDGRTFTQVGSGDSLFPKPVLRKDILLGPSQRADVVVNFAGEFGKRIVLKSVPRVNRPKNGIGTPSASLMQFRVSRHTTAGPAVPGTLLTTLPPLPTPTTIDKTWTINSPGKNTHGFYWRINGKMFNPKRVDYTVTEGTTEVWKLVNSSHVTHYFHIHEEQWRTVRRDGHAPPAWELGLQDTWRLDPGESVLVEGTFSDHTGRFMLHCHMLDHEDHGLMAQFKVVQ